MFLFYTLHNCYHIDSSPDFLNFKFISIGTKRRHHKAVCYRKSDVKGIYDLGFSDKEPVSGSISDLSVTNNNDNQKVLTTIIRTLYLFTDHNPDAVVIASGSTPPRTRLYRMCITNNLVTIKQDFSVHGLTDMDCEPFRKA
ncbi:hypothetical protein FC093_09595 [Ilyomonas limi]|uniref:Uncharacterized protein n=1 Tax=Ilyomonas limi TaxID=2575867 RepID=A0A4U3L1R0_9BACT|nr:hypothetical protein [Ilyomonas limi]TKK68938.1 hypothetical protein FC093_09595 [Ilyomonas limi]